TGHNKHGTGTDNRSIHLTGAAVIENGSLLNNTTLDVAGAGNKLDGESVDNNGTIEVLTLGALTIDLGSIIDNTGGNVTVDAGGVLTLTTATTKQRPVRDHGQL